MFETGFVVIFLVTGLYGLVHSLLASLRAKALAERWLGEVARRWYRLLYVIFVSVTFLPLPLLILILPDRSIYTIPLPWALLTGALQLLAVGGLLLAFKDISVGHFLGLRQALSGPAAGNPLPLVTRGVFRYTRHPLYLFSILFIWLTPGMTWNLLAFNLAATLYMLIGAIFEERKLLHEFGEPYAAYRRRTPWLLPRIRPGQGE